MPLFNPPDVQWNNAPLNAGWQSFGAGWQVPQYARNGDLILLRGSATWFSGGYDLFSLPDGFRPISSIAFPVATNNGSFAQIGLISVSPSGLVSWGGMGGLAFVSLDGIIFGIDP